LGGFLRRVLIAFDRGDLAKLPFSDDINADSRLLMRRNVRERVAALAPFLTFDQDPYIVSWARTDGSPGFWMPLRSRTAIPTRRITTVDGSRSTTCATA
jgi:uncharacterized membrane protein (UPF0182 family)